jgi:hypothetical protein
MDQLQRQYKNVDHRGTQKIGSNRGERDDYSLAGAKVY